MLEVILNKTNDEKNIQHNYFEKLMILIRLKIVFYTRKQKIILKLKKLLCLFDNISNWDHLCNKFKI